MAYNVTPIPDVDDDQKLQQYIQDRRVIGVCVLLVHLATPQLINILV
jgi:hypothetical protein